MKVRVWAVVFLLAGALLGFFDAAEFVLGPSNEGLRKFAVPFRLGLDLQGGTHLVYRADTSALPSTERGEAMEGIKDVIERRVNLFGVSEPVVQTETVGDERRLIVELAGVFDISEAIKLIGETPYLEFKELMRDEAGNISATSSASVSDFVFTGLDGRYIERAQVIFDHNSGLPSVGLDFNSAGAEIFEALTARNVGNPLAVFLDGVIISAPIVQQEISGGNAHITGDFTVDEAQQLVRRFNAGALPVPITLISQQSVEASLGVVSLERSLRAGLYGLLGVIIFMLIFYRFWGLVAVVALGVYAALVLFLFKIIPVTLSSAGVAGFILSIGMSVDAEILIFERMKEELKKGRSRDSALEEGFRRAWTSIRDSNVSSLITASILFWFGTSLVKGFATTLFIGIAVNLLTSMVITHYFLKAIFSFKKT